MSAVEERPAVTSRRRSLVLPLARPETESPPSNPPRRRRGAKRWVPYTLISPAMLVLLAIIGFPIVFAIVISFQAFQLVTGGPVLWVGFKNYQDAISQGFLSVLVRTAFFTLAVIMRRAARWARVFLSVALVVVWAIPQITATEIFAWLFNGQFGLVNWLLGVLHIGNFTSHDWWLNPVSLLGIATLIVVWGAVPFVAITIFAGLLQIPDDLYEAARVDGAGFISQMRTITLPLLAPILLLLATLSTLWDSRVFTQIFVLQTQGGIPSDTNLFGLWSYSTSFSGQNYGAGAAISLFFTAVLLVVTIPAVRMMVKGASPV